MNKVLISGIVLKADEKKDFKANMCLQDTEFVIVDEIGIITFSAETITILFALAEALTFSAIYDIMKYTLHEVISRLKIVRQKHKISNEEITKVTIIKDGITESMEFNFVLTEEQKDKVIDNTIMKFIDVSNG